MSESTFVWFDLMTTDVEAAKAFYSDVVGWTVQSFGADASREKPYDMFVGSRGPMGGCMDMPDEPKALGVPPHWLAYIHVPDIEGSLVRVAELGGQLMGRFAVDGVGQMAIIRDPANAVVCLMQPTDPDGAPGHAGRPQAGEVSWSELTADDLDTAWAFYSALLGWEVRSEMEMGPMGTYRMYGPSGCDAVLGGMMTKPPQAPVASWLYYVNVVDLDGALERVKSGGGSIINGPMEVPGGDRVAVCMDPQGAAFALHTFA